MCYNSRMMQIRLDKFICDFGLASRKDVKLMIKSGRVTVDGEAVNSGDMKIDADEAVVRLDGEILRHKRFHYYMMDKPAGVLTAARDKKQETVLDILPIELRRMGVFPVGRLDKDTTGLLLITDDGDFAHKVISPKSGVEKVYYATVDGEPNDSDVRAFHRGVTLRDGTKCLPAGLEPLGNGACLVTVREGKYHQVKRMLAAREKPVINLRRLSIGGLKLDESLGAGGFRELTENELCIVLG